MTFTVMVKEEISKEDLDQISVIALLSAFIRYGSNISKDNITITLENASLARLIYKLIKNTFMVNPKVMVRVQKRFRVKQIYILKIIR